MKKFNFFIIIFILFLVLALYALNNKICYQISSNQPVFEVIDNLRLDKKAENIKLLVADTKGHLGKIFLFSNDDGSIATTLSVENPNIEGPSFRIVKGHTRDWLVVTTIENSGTGYMKHIDTWYIANPYYQANLAVLSYPSDGYITEWTDIQNQNLNTSVDAISEDDNVIDVKFILKTCGTQDECAETAKIARYVLNNDKNIFILDDKKSEINALQVSDLLTIH